MDLTEQDYQVRPVLSGEIAIKAVQTNPPDFILLDILMSEMEDTICLPSLFVSLDTYD